MKKRIVMMAFMLIFAFGVGVLCPYIYFHNKYRDVEEIIEINRILKKESYVALDKRSALNGYVNCGIDSYSGIKYKLTSDEEAEIYVNESGCALASGFRIRKSDSGNILISYVEEGKAAYDSGLRREDEIVSINGESVVTKGFDKNANKLLGKKGTSVDLIVLRGNEKIEVTFIRDHVFINSVIGEKIDDVGYIRILDFGEFSRGQFTEVYDQLKECNSYIIDVRDNSGGNTGNCIEMMRILAPDIKVRMYDVRGEITEYSASGGAGLKKPVVILINEKSASSSEIIASSIKQYNENSLTVGMKTYGKGVYQMEKELENGDILHFTAGIFTVGEWENWDGVGISPDIEVKMDSSLIGTDSDIQLKKALELLE